MKVLIITGTLQERSGIGRYSRGVARNLQKAGVEVIVFCEQEPNDLHIEWHRLLSSRSLISFLRNVLKARKLARKVDVVHALDAWPFGIYGYASVYGTPKKLFINGVGTYSVAPLHSFWLGPIIRRAYNSAKGIFCISSYVKDRLLQAGVSRGIPTVVHLGSDPLPAPSPEEEAQCRRRFSIVEERFPIILTVGDIKHRKGQLDTLQAVERLKDKYPRILYIVVGTSNPAYAEKMRAYAASNGLADNLRFVSSIPDTDLTSLYSISTLIALNSNNNEIRHHFEGFGLTLVEGYQFGKPAVGSRGCGIEDAIEDGQTGMLANQGDALDIANKIEKILENLESFSQNARMHYAAFDWSKTVAAYIDGYKKSVD